MRTRGEGETGSRRRLATLAIVLSLSAGALFLFQRVESTGQAVHAEAMLVSSRLMQEGTIAIRACREASGAPLNASDDVNATGLLGSRYSTLTTSVGSLEAKRTTTNPNMAGLVARLLLDAGARKGDAVAIGASGSFPALVLAALCAARALDLQPVLIYSLGASQWGANDPAFTWLEMEECLVAQGILSYRVVAVSLGGDTDRATELNPATASQLRARAQASGIPVIEATDLVADVRERMAIYQEKAGGRRIAAFVNVGGAWANLGTDPAILELQPGLDRVKSLPDPSRRGVLFEMAREGIPIVHLLNIKGLVVRYGLPWDPTPLPAVGEGEIYHDAGRVGGWLLAIVAAYLAAILVVALLWKRLTRKKGERGRGLPGTP
jgi:poly-gamma-glutamate system protein